MTTPWSMFLLPALVLFFCFGVLLLIVHFNERDSAPKKSPPFPRVEQLWPEAAAAHPREPVDEGADNRELMAVAPPPFSPGIFPCSGCHEDLQPNTTPRKLTRRHKEIVLQHDEENRWCLDCHTAGNIDKLHLASGKLIEFSESYKLCGQCHGPTLRDWKAGEHGKRTGSWSGKKQYLLCVHCHNPHAPKFKPLQPLPPPVRPKDLR